VKKLVIATRKSPLALAQSEQVAAHLRAALGVETELLKIVTTGDRQTGWSLEKQGGKGLFTGELEQSLLRGESDVAVHSTKDLPGEMTPGLAIAGYLPRADPRDVLVIRAGLAAPRLVATDSPRRRLQLAILFPGVEFTGIRGNVDTRLRKIAGGLADATALAAAGMARLGIGSWEGLEFRLLEFSQVVPAVGQAAIAVQSRAGDAARLASLFDAATQRCVSVERALQSALGGGCHTALGAHATVSTLHFFHEATGIRSLPIGPSDFDRPAAAARRILGELGLTAPGAPL
jgi:hydroxymethylbilane synthase